MRQSRTVWTVSGECQSGAGFSSTATPGCVVLQIEQTLLIQLNQLRLKKPHSQEWLCYVNCSAAPAQAQFNCCVEGVQPEATPAQVSRRKMPVVAADAGSRLVAEERKVMYRPLPLIVADVLAPFA
jgi:hypothetical protein